MSKLKLALSLFVLIVVVCFVFVTVGSTAPKTFPVGDHITIKKGVTLSQAAETLSAKSFIRSTLLFKVYVKLLGPTSGVQTGSYYFGDSESALRIAYRLVKGIEGIQKVKVTIPEGLASPDIARAIKRLIPTFEDKKFLALARPLEGYLFPDTYFFDQFTTPEEVVDAMNSNFIEHTKDIKIPRTLSDKSFRDVITMASLLEEESGSSTERRIIAGILWKRIEDGMLLQVDAPFFYIFGKTSAQLTLNDLATSSPYNLYKHLGLPPTPIDNPSLGAIIDAVNPVETKYWYFLAGGDGRTHFAETFEQHIQNRYKYLN